MGSNAQTLPNPPWAVRMTGNETAQAWARDIADKARTGSLERAAAGCLVVIFASAKTLAAARRMLPEIPLADVRQAAAGLLDQLTTKES